MGRRGASGDLVAAAPAAVEVGEAPTAALALLRATTAPLVLLWGPTGRVYANPAARERLGGDARLEAGMPAAQLWPGAAHPIAEVLAATFVGMPEPMHLVLPAGRPPRGPQGDGLPAAVACSVGGMRDANGQVTGALLTLPVTSTRAGLQGALPMQAASQPAYVALTDTMPQLVWACDREGNCVYMSAQWTRYTGQSIDDLLGFGWLERVIHPDDQERTKQHWFGALAGRHAYDLDYRLRRHDGSYRWFVGRGVAVRDGTGAAGHWFGTCTDIQAQKEVEAQLVEALAARDQFASVASHELKTPLTSLMLQNQRLLRGIQRGQAAALPMVVTVARDSQHQIARLNGLVDDMLDATRIRNGKLLLAPAPMALAPLVADVVERLTPLFGERGHACPTFARDAEPEGAWDSRRVEQVLTNLLTNALRYGGGQPVEVQVAAADGHAIVAVRDHGPGIAAADQAKIFHRFERATAPAGASGLGLGLFISREIALAHGGELAVSSSPGKGASFVLRLPMA